VGRGLLRTEALRYRAVVAAGGIGSGRFFLLDGRHTLGREESRAGRFLDRRDYCKGHIVCHYLAGLLGPELVVSLVGAVGTDEVGLTLWHEMQRTGIDLRYSRRLEGKSTLFSFCFLYSDGSGGNMTTADSASAAAGPEDIARAEPALAEVAGAAMVIALPEVPLASRAALLAMGSRHGSLRVASFTSQEMAEADVGGLLHDLDYLAVNLDEARALARVWGDDAGALAGAAQPGETVERLVEVLRSRYPRLRVTVTAGGLGSWCWDGAALLHERALPVEAQGTSGAGDAFLAGVVAGIAIGLDFREAHRLGALMGAASVLSPHTINPDITELTLRELFAIAGWGDADALRAAIRGA